MELSLMHGLQAFSEGVAGALVASVWQGLVLAATIWICLRMLPKTGAATRFAIWMAAFGVLAMLPLVRLPLGFGSGVLTPRTLAHGPLVHADVRWSLALTALWLAVSLYRAAGLAVNGWRLRGLWRRAVPVVTDADVSSLLTDGRRTVELCTSEELERPSLIGFFSPRIVIPRWLFDRLSEAELRQIVMHEMEHLRRGDDWINLVQKLSLVVFPLNPALVWIERELCLERELACDAGVIRATGAPKAYATCLTSLAERSLDRRVAALTLGAWERRSQLAERVHTILRREKVLSPVQAGVVMSLAVAGLVAGAGELSRCPQLVSFSAPVRVVTARAGVSTAGIATGGMQNVVYRDGAAGRSMLPHETLLKASMDGGGSAVAPAPAKGAGKVRARKASGLAKKHAAGRRGVMVLSSWRTFEQQDEMAAPRMTLTVVEEGDVRPSTVTSTFAVPTVGGWLIIQL